MKVILESWNRFISEQKKTTPRIIFMAGAPGAGKSTAIEKLGLSGMNVINPDDFYEPALERAGLGKNITKVKDDYMDARDKLIAALEIDTEEKIKHDEIENLYAQAEQNSNLKSLKKAYDQTRDKVVQQAKIFNQARRDAKSKQAEIVDSGESLIVDGTGGIFGQIRNQKSDLEDKGYKTAMVFVDIPLEVALDRQEKRLQAGGRSLPAKSVEKSWNAVSKNKDKYLELFGENFFLVNTSDEDFDFDSVKSRLDRFLSNLSESFQVKLKPRLIKQMKRLLRHGGNQDSGPFKEKAPIDYRGSAPPGASGG
jgi:predicted ABC-type ATPase